MKSTKAISSDLQIPGFPEVVHLKQYDANTRYITIPITDGGSSFTLPDNPVFMIGARLPDGSKVLYDKIINASAPIGVLVSVDPVKWTAQGITGATFTKTASGWSKDGSAVDLDDFGISITKGTPATGANIVVSSENAANILSGGIEIGLAPSLSMIAGTGMIELYVGSNDELISTYCRELQIHEAAADPYGAFTPQSVCTIIAQIQAFVQAELTAHPEWTTTVMDGSITYAKLNAEVMSYFAKQSDMNMHLPTNLANVTFTSGKYVRFSTGALTNSSAGSASDYIDVSGLTKIVYTKVFLTQSSVTTWGISFYDASKVYISDSGVRAGYNADTIHYELAEADVPATAKYVRITKHNDLPDTPVVYDKADYDSKLPARVDEAENDILALDNEIGAVETFLNDVSANGWSRVLAPFELGGWQSYTSKDSRSYRVRTSSRIKYPYDVYLKADKGYMVYGYTSSETLGGTIITLPANTELAMYVRRFTEDTTETVDVETFASKVHVSTALSDINRLAYTFTDVSMFERVGISGDSYAGGGGIISGVTALTWGKNLQRQAGVQVDIYAKSGDSIVDWVVNQTEGLPALLAGPECGLYWFQHGINGTSTAEALGTSADMSANPKPQTFYGQYVYAIEAVKAAFPNARIVLATITGTSYGLSQSTYANANTAIKAIAEYCNVPCIDITEDDFFRSPWYSDGMRSNHPTAMIAAGMAMAYRRLLAKCIMKNPTYFVEYGSD